MKLLVSSYNQAILKNLYFSGVFGKLIKQGFELTVVTFSFKKHYFKDSLHDKGIEVISIGRVEENKFIDKLFRRLFLLFQHTNYWKYKVFEFEGTDNYLGRFYLTVAKGLNFRYFPRRALIRFLRFIFLYIKIRADDDDWSKIENIDLFFSTDIFSEEDTKLLKMVHQRNIKIVSMVRSWDNCFSKGVLRFLPGNVFVNNDLIKGYLSANHYYPENNIHIVGFPQFDKFFSDAVIPKDTFYDLLDINPGKKIVLLLPAGEQLSSTDNDIVEDILSSFSSPELHGNELFLIVRNHPGHPAKIKNRDNCLVMNAGHKFKEGDKFTEFTNDDAVLVRSLILYSSVIVNVSSSFGIDALTYEKPQITINYDGNKKLSYNNSVKRYHDEEHMRDFLDSGASIVVNTADELVESVINFILHPEFNHENVVAEKKRQIGDYLAHSGDRIGDLLVRLGH